MSAPADAVVFKAGNEWMMQRQFGEALTVIQQFLDKLMARPGL